MQVVIGVVTVLLCSLCSLSSAQVDLRTCGDENSDVTCSFFFNKVDEEFRQRDNLYTLRKSFFPTEGAPPILFDIFMTLDIQTAPDILCTDDSYIFGTNSTRNVPDLDKVCNIYECGPYSIGWEHQWSKTILTTFIEREDLELLQNTNFFAFSAATFNSFDTSVFSQEEESLDNVNNSNSTAVSQTGNEIVQFVLSIEYLPCRPDDGVLLDAWEDILIWVQLYAENFEDLGNVVYSQEGRGFAFRESGNRQQGITVPFLAVIHILLNIVFALGVTYFLQKYHSELYQVKGKQYQLIASMFWAMVFMCLISAVVLITGNCYLYYALIFIDDQSLGVFGFRIASDITVLIIVFIQFIVAMLTPHDTTFFIPHLIRRTLCCNQCHHCCGSMARQNLLRRFILGIAMWIIMVFMQLVISSLLPVAVVIITNPVPTLAYLSIMVALFFCMIIFVAYFLNAFEGNYISRHKLSPEERRKSSIGLSTLAKDASLASSWLKDKLILVVQAFCFLVIFVIVALVVILYLNFVRAGANTNTVGGLFFSLVPSVALGAITWGAKKHLFKEFEEEEEEGEGEGDEGGNKESKDTLIQIGGISWNRKSTKKRRNTRKDDNHTTHNGSEDTGSVGTTIPNPDTVIEMDDAQQGNNTDTEGEDLEDGEDLANSKVKVTDPAEEPERQSYRGNEDTNSMEEVGTQDANQDSNVMSMEKEQEAQNDDRDGESNKKETNTKTMVTQDEQQNKTKRTRDMSMEIKEFKLSFMRDMATFDRDDTSIV